MTTLETTCPIYGDITVTAPNAWLHPYAWTAHGPCTHWEWTIRCPACGDTHTRRAYLKTVRLLRLAGVPRIGTRPDELDDPVRHEPTLPVINLNDVIELANDLTNPALWGAA